MSARRPIIGVLGGMGPEATVDLMTRVIRATPAQDDCDHVHLIVDQNPDIPSRIAALIEGTGPSPADALQHMARRLNRAGAVALAIPCNTAHAYLEEIRAASEAPVLDMIEMTAKRLAADAPGARIGMLASSAVDITGLYAKAFAAHGLKAEFPARQDEVMAVIKAVKRDRVGAAERAALGAVAGELMAAGSARLLIACTELSVIADALPPEAPRLDALDVLAAEIVAKGLGRDG